MLNTIVPATTTSKPMEQVTVICATLNSKLAVHRTIGARGYTVTHVPSGFAARTMIRRKKDAIALMLRLDAAGDWNFRTPYGRKWEKQKAALKPLVDAVEQY